MPSPYSRILLLSMAVFLFGQPARGQNATFSGLMFGDAYYVAAYDDPADVADEDKLQGQNGLWFRRIYLGFDFKLDDAWSVRLRTEMNSPGDFTTRATLVPFAKDAYVRWRNANHQVYLGLSGTPTFSTIEDVWGYRAVEKTLVDLQRLGPSRDIGIAARGNLDAQKKLRYNVMLAQGSSTNSETDKGKKAMLALAVHPVDGVVLEVYGDYEERPGETNRYMVQGFAAYRQEAGRIGVQYVYQNRDVPTGEHVELSGLSVFGAVTLTDKIDAFARYDAMMDADSDGQANPDAGRIAYIPFEPGAETSNLMLAGLDFAVSEQVHFMPNVEAVVYDGDGPDPTIMPRLTFFVTFP